jgi:hypothetical protein
MSKTLTIYLAADIRKLSSGLNTGKAELNAFDRTMGNLSSTMSNMLGPALIGAGIAAAALAVKFGVDGVNAAMADEAAAAKLATTMENLGLAQDTTAAEANIDAMQRQFGVADDELRPAFDRLVRSIGDTDKATSTLQLAMDVSAGSGKSLDAVVQALGKAYDGNTAGLSKLGAGIDKATLATGDMNLITAALAKTFDGQAATAANTYQGQLDRLAVGFSELQESFGHGFLSAMTDANNTTDDLMQTMKDLEPQLAKVGKAAGAAVIGLAGFGGELVDVTDSAVKLYNEPNWPGLIDHIRNTVAATDQFKGVISKVPAIGGFLGALYDIADAWIAVDNASSFANGDLASLGGGNFGNVAADYATGADAASASTARWNAQAAALGKNVSATGGNLRTYIDGLHQTTSGGGSAAASTVILTTAFDDQRTVVEGLSAQLMTQTAALDTATAAVDAYATAMATSLLSGINLGDAATLGAELGTSTLTEFDNQINQAKWFANVLTSIKASGGDQALIDQLASLGPAAGGALGQEMIDKGLIQTFSDKLVDVVASANTTAQAMVPEFLLAGMNSAEQFVNGTIDGLATESARLKMIGRTIGKPIGLNIKAEILDAVAEAVKIAQASKTAAAAERAASIAAERVTVSEQQIAQALSRLITNSNSRTGYSTGAPTPSPVLG